MRKYVLVIILAVVASGTAFAQTPTNTPTATPTNTPTSTPTATPSPLTAAITSGVGPIVRLCNGKYNGACGSIERYTATQDPAQEYVFQSKGTWNAYVDIWVSCDYGTTKAVVFTIQPTTLSPTSKTFRSNAVGGCWIGGTKRNWISGDVDVEVTQTGNTSIFYHAFPTPTPTPTP